MARFFTKAEQLNLLIMAGLADVLVEGRLTKVSVRAAKKILKRGVAPVASAGLRAAPRLVGTAGRVGFMVAKRHPVIFAAALAYEGIIHRDQIMEVAEQIQEGGIGEVLEGIAQPVVTQVKSIRRKISKANRAVKYGMGLLRTGTKASTGADKGKLPKGAFRTATIAAGLANPNTQSKIGKGSSILKSLARKIRSWW
jgi:hypothetical protein